MNKKKWLAILISSITIMNSSISALAFNNFQPESEINNSEITIIPKEDKSITNMLYNQDRITENLTTDKIELHNSQNTTKVYYNDDSIKFGDINSDGKIDSTDGLLILRHIKASEDINTLIEHEDWYLTNKKLYAADINNDGHVDTTDHTLILEQYAGTKNIITLRYNSAGSIISGSYIYVLGEDNYYSEFPQVSREGYSFKGWHTSQTGGNSVSTFSKIENYDHTLYSHWEANNYHVTFDANGGKIKNINTTSTERQTFGEPYLLESFVHRKGYCFAGWYTAPAGGEKITFSSIVSKAYNHTLYAHWKDAIPVDLSKKQTIVDSITPESGRGITYCITVKNPGTLKITTTNIPIDNENPNGFTPAIDICSENMDTIASFRTAMTPELTGETKLEKGIYYIFFAADAGLFSALDSTGKYTLELEFTEENSSTDKLVPNPDIWLADSLIFGLKIEDSKRLASPYKTFQSFNEPLYKELGGYLLEDKPLIAMSSTWTVFLNGEFHKNPNYLYEALLMDYLKYSSTDGSIDQEFQEKLISYEVKIFCELSNNIAGANEELFFSDLWSTMSVQEASEYLKKNVTSIDNMNTAVSNVSAWAGNTKELVRSICGYLALQNVKDERVVLLKEARKACQEMTSPNEDFIKAVDVMVEAIENAPINYMAEKTCSFLWGQILDTSWDTMCNACPPLKAIDFGINGLDIMFNSTGGAENNLKLALLYTIDYYFQLGMRNNSIGFINNGQNTDYAQKFVSCFQAYIDFQRYGNDFAIQWIDGVMQGGALNKVFAEIFYRENIETSKELKQFAITQNNTRKGMLDLIEEYRTIYNKQYMKDTWKNSLTEESQPSNSLKFVDVNIDDWYYNSILYVNKKNLMTGLNETTFAPTAPIARSHFAVILHRMNGAPKVPYTPKFPDISENIWYTDAILWASNAEIVTGYTDTGLFGPGNNINREQMAVMMYRYAKYKGYPINETADYETFTDAATVSAYAKDAMNWAVGSGIITGKNNGTLLDPLGNASRAECATIIMRFTEKYTR